METYAVIGRTDNRVYLAPVDDAPFDIVVIDADDPRVVIVDMVVDESFLNAKERIA